MEHSSSVASADIQPMSHITDRRRHELERGLLAAIVDSSKDIIIGHTLDGTITSWNASAVSVLGLSADKAIGNSLAMLLPEDSMEVAQLLDSCRDTEPAEFEMMWRRRDGSSVPVAVTCSPVHDSSGLVVAGSLIARDMGERVSLQRALNKSQIQLSALVEQAPVGIAQSTLEGELVLVNPHFSIVTGRSAQDLVGMQVRELIHPDDQAAAAALRAKLIETGEPVDIEKRYLRPDGSVVWVSNHLSLVRTGEGEPPLILKVVLDISERHRAAQHRELMLGELNHRVKNTLASVQSIARQTLSGTVTPETFHDMFLARLQALSSTHNLLAVDAWNGVGLRALVDAELAPYLAGDGRGQALLKGMDVKLTPKTALAMAMAFHELATNAVKYGALSTPDGRVEVQWTLGQEQPWPWLHLQWREHGGPTVMPPTRRGFGSRLIAEGLAFELDGEVALKFDPNGVMCSIDVPIEEDLT
jgi:two-component system CheB/CheR fusion protein